MNSRLVVVDLFAEDRAHEALLKSLVTRIATQEKTDVTLRVRSARGGHGRAIEEFRLYQSVIAKGNLNEAHPDIVVVAVDGNCTAFAKKRDEIRAATLPSLGAAVVPASPDPHVERWYMADPLSFRHVVGVQPSPITRKCERGLYKEKLADAVVRAGHPPTLGGVEFASELASAMNLYRAGKKDHSLRAFIKDLKAALQEVAGSMHSGS